MTTESGKEYDMGEATKAGEKFQELVGILDKLRGPGGCPWDREQDARSIANYFLEEVYEAVDALSKDDPGALAEELGDVLMEVVFLSRIFAEKGLFDVSDALDSINAKMIRRHPHVFGDARYEDARRVLDAWVKQKKEEKNRSHHFEGLAATAPALLTAFQIGTRVSLHGFDWPNPAEALVKAKEEIGELEEAMAAGAGPDVEEELGDVLFTLAHVARLLKINPEMALRKANEKFVGRFAALEKRLAEKGKTLAEATLSEMDAVWDEIKRT
jgi:MazG family protein